MLKGNKHIFHLLNRKNRIFVLHKTSTKTVAGSEVPAALLAKHWYTPWSDLFIVFNVRF